MTKKVTFLTDYVFPNMQIRLTFTKTFFVNLLFLNEKRLIEQKIQNGCQGQ